jgi:hypothetical protein
MLADYIPSLVMNEDRGVIDVILLPVSHQGSGEKRSRRRSLMSCGDIDQRSNGSVTSIDVSPV